MSEAVLASWVDITTVIWGPWCMPKQSQPPLCSILSVRLRACCYHSLEFCIPALPLAIFSLSSPISQLDWMDFRAVTHPEGMKYAIYGHSSWLVRTLLWWHIWDTLLCILHSLFSFSHQWVFFSFPHFKKNSEPAPFISEMETIEQRGLLTSTSNVHTMSWMHQQVLTKQLKQKYK